LSFLLSLLLAAASFWSDTELKWVTLKSNALRKELLIVHDRLLSRLIQVEFPVPHDDVEALLCR